MNKLVPKPTSSPGRTTTEKFPPPLMRFLRSNNGSKSSTRRRSRANPLFFKKKSTVVLDTQEPSSPKVTCIGQVRVRRSKKPPKKIIKKTTTAAGSAAQRRRERHRLCRWLKTLKSKWVLFFRCGNCRNHPKDSQEQEQEKKEEHDTVTVNDTNNDNGNGNDDVKINKGLTNLGSTPGNALLLTRCRSAPYRSSSLGSIFRESRVEIEGDQELGFGEEIKKGLKIEEEEEEEKRVDGDEGINGGLKEEGTCNGEEGLKGVKEEGEVVPLILTRCKSEPARRWDQLLV